MVHFSTQDKHMEQKMEHIDQAAYSIDEFCKAHRISRPMFYKLAKSNRGPRLMQVGRRQLITMESAANWRKFMEEASAA